MSDEDGVETLTESLRELRMKTLKDEKVNTQSSGGNTSALNLAHNPSRDQFAAMIAACDDNAASHIIFHWFKHLHCPPVWNW